jgi:acyl-CoA thioesterase-1
MTRRALLLLCAGLMVGCSFRNVGCGMPKSDQAAAGEAPAATGQGGVASADPRAFKIVFLGDSLTAGFGLLSEQAYPAQIEKLFIAEGYDEVDIINAGISGDTTAGGLRRVEGVLEPGVKVLVVALGGNDALRGLTTKETHDNLLQIIQTARGKGLQVFLCGMEAPTNLGEDYRKNFRDLFTQLLSESRGITFVPFLLEGVAANPALNLADGIHPNVEGARVIAQALYPKLRTIVDSLGGGG